MELRSDTYCGLNCGACPVGMASEKGDQALLAILAERWGNEAGELLCGGCKSGRNSVFCSSCGLRDCARERELEFCFQCTDYPCDRLVSFRDDDAPHHSAVLRNLSRIRDRGLKVWLEDEAGRWSCDVCGRRFGWYSETCEECGSVLYNAILEEKDIQD